MLLAILAIYLGDSFYPSTPELTIFSYGIGVAALAFASGVFTPIKVRSLGEPSSTSSDFKAASMLGVAFPMLLSTSMFMVMNWTDTLMIGYYLDARDVGYRIAFKIAALITLLSLPLTALLLQYFSSFKAKKKTCRDLEKWCEISATSTYLSRGLHFCSLFYSQTSSLSSLDLNFRKGSQNLII